MIDRELESILKKRFKTGRSVYVFGPRQSGKTTLVRKCFPHLPYVSLEDPDQLEYVQNDPRGFLNALGNEAIIDEPQRFPDLLSYLQSEIDINQKCYVLTSSQNFLLMAKVGQSLAGRISILNLLPLSKNELDRHIKKQGVRSISQLLPSILMGGYPEIWQNPDVREYWYSDYVQTYLERDVRQIINVQNLSLFSRFLKLCAGRSGMLLNKASLASDCGISEAQVARWLSVLEASGVVFLLAPYFQNFNKRVIKSPKLYFIDSGLMCHLLSIESVSQLHVHPLYGAIIETYVVSELRKSEINKGKKGEFYFWRDSQGNEIDLLISDGNELSAIEIKAGETITPSLIASAQKWAAISGKSAVTIYYGGTESQTRSHLKIYPIDSA